ncbi:MAG TPA: SHOCT domain-containing protein, partial [Daejeonella sp.]
PEDELTQKLQKLKTLYEKQLISQEEYENKKAEILARL